MMFVMFPTNSRVETLPRGLGEFRADGKAARNGDGAERFRKIERSIAYMTQHLNQSVRVAEFAAQANVSLSHFFALFKRRNGSAPMDYFTQLRMQHACRLLNGTSASVKEVAAAMGYNDPFYFSRVFKSVNRVAPSRYRVRQKEAKNKADSRCVVRPLEIPGTNSSDVKPEPRFNGANHYQFA